MKYSEFLSEYRPYSGKGQIRGNVVFAHKEHKTDKVYVSNDILRHITDDDECRIATKQLSGGKGLIILEAKIWVG